MNDNSDRPVDAGGDANTSVPDSTPDYTTPPTGTSGPSGQPAPQANPSSWQPGQYDTSQASGPPTAPSYPDPATQGPPPPPHYSYGFPPPDVQSQSQGQGQPTTYMPPQYPGQASYSPPPTPVVPPNVQPPYYQPANYGGMYPQQSAYAYGPPKDPTVGLLLELIGYAGFLGIGHIWAGKTARGVGLLVGFWIYLTLAVLLTIVLIGCVMLVGALAIPLASGFYLKNEMEREQAAMGIRR